MFSRPSFTASQRGISLIELIVVAGLVACGSAVAIPATVRMVNSARGDSAMAMTATFLETTRNRAVAERRNMVLTFSTTDILVERVEVPSGIRTTVDRLVLEAGEEFARIGGNALPDPEGFVSGALPVFFQGVQPVMFTSDGSLIDAQGDVINASIFVARPGMLDTQRAISIWGVTGMVRSWKWSGQWIQ
jgi:type II secretory pathway pseudopilin PulG